MVRVIVNGENCSKCPKTSVMLESLAWNMLVHWLVGSPAWGLNKMYQFYCQFVQSDLPFNPWFEMLWNPCDSGLKQTKTKSSSEVLHFRLQLSWSLHLSGELCEGCCIPLETELVEETTVPVKPRFITLQETYPTLVRKRTKGTHMHQPEELRLSKNCVVWFVYAVQLPFDWNWRWKLKKWWLPGGISSSEVPCSIVLDPAASKDPKITCHPDLKWDDISQWGNYSSMSLPNALFLFRGIAVISWQD